MNISKDFQKKYDDAFEFATKKHSGQFRKGTKIPYIVHLYEVTQILKEEKADEITIIAGILHDTVEDTDTKIEEIEEKFGSDVAKLVSADSEDKSLPYLERKKLHMQQLKNADERAKLVNLADKLSNLKSIYLDTLYMSNTFDRFNGTKDEIKQYYKMALDALSSLKSRKSYKQLKKYYKLTFCKK